MLKRPKPTRLLPRTPNPATSFDDAVQRVREIQHKGGEVARPDCRTQLLSHGKQTETAVLLLHGYTNCPRKFREFGTRLFERGHNVLIPRMPHHGFPDPLTNAHSRLTAEEMIVHAEDVVDAARGLGKRIAVAGLSAGGTLASWIAQNRSDVKGSVIISPVFGFAGFPAWSPTVLRPLLLGLPNFYRWWDPELKAFRPAMQHAYPRYASRALGQILRIADSVAVGDMPSGPDACEIVVVTNPHDSAVHNEATLHAVKNWEKRSGRRIQKYQFDAVLELPHDMIDPQRGRRYLYLVYRVLIDFVEFVLR
jgi:carboxylesterase